MRFRSQVVHGTKRPYTSWTFLIVPEAVVESVGRKRFDVRGELAGVEFTGTVAKGEGVYRVPIPKDVLERAGVAPGSSVQVGLEVDPSARVVEVPEELAAVLASQPALGRAFGALPPSLQRAWSTHVAEARQPATRVRRAARAAEGIRGRRYPNE